MKALAICGLMLAALCTSGSAPPLTLLQRMAILRDATTDPFHREFIKAYMVMIEANGGEEPPSTGGRSAMQRPYWRR